VDEPFGSSSFRSLPFKVIARRRTTAHAAERKAKRERYYRRITGVPARREYKQRTLWIQEREFTFPQG